MNTQRIKFGNVMLTLMSALVMLALIVAVLVVGTVVLGQWRTLTSRVRTWAT